MPIWNWVQVQSFPGSARILRDFERGVAPPSNRRGFFFCALLFLSRSGLRPIFCFRGTPPASRPPPGPLAPFPPSPPGLERVEHRPMPMITDTQALADFCAKLRSADYVTVDTEFMREKTYWPVLCLVQLAGPDDARAVVAEPTHHGRHLGIEDRLGQAA